MCCLFKTPAFATTMVQLGPSLLSLSHCVKLKCIIFIQNIIISITQLSLVYRTGIYRCVWTSCWETISRTARLNSFRVPLQPISIAQELHPRCEICCVGVCLLCPNHSLYSFSECHFDSCITIPCCSALTPRGMAITPALFLFVTLQANGEWR